MSWPDRKGRFGRLISAGLLGMVGAMGAAAQACPLPPLQAGEQRIQQGGVELAWRAEPGGVSVGQPFQLHVRLCPATARLLRVDATMPEHRHGMNYRPSIHLQGEGRWRVDGMLWHMAGRWELALEVEQGAERSWLRQAVVLR